MRSCFVLAAIAVMIGLVREVPGQSNQLRKPAKRSTAAVPRYRPAHEKIQPELGTSEVPSAKPTRPMAAARKRGAVLPAAFSPGMSDANCAHCSHCDQPSISPGCCNARDCGDCVDDCTACGVECDDCGACASAPCTPSFWGRAEYLGWWTKGVDTPPLATTAAGAFDQATAGVVGQPNTSILFGDEPLHADARSGGRFTLGMWIDDWSQCGIEGTYLTLNDDEESFIGSNPNFVVLARPFLDVQTGTQDAQLIVFPGFVSGTLNIHAESKFQAYEVNLRRKRYQIGTCSVEGLVGYRGATLDDSLHFSSSTLGLSGPLLNASIALNEAFVTENQFHGGQLGLRWINQRCCDWSAEFLTKVALGNTQSSVNVTGTTTSSLAGQSQTTQAGLLAQGTNIRSLEQNEFSTLSEVGVSIRRHFACDLTVNFGYTFLYWSDVLRAGEVIDSGINPSQIPPNTLTGAARPELRLDSQAFWAQGLTVGLEYLF